MPQPVKPVVATMPPRRTSIRKTYRPAARPFLRSRLGPTKGSRSSPSATDKVFLPSLPVTSAVTCEAVWTLTLIAVGPPLDATVAGEKLMVAPAGRPVAENVTVPGYVVLVGATRTVYGAEAPGSTVWLWADVSVRVKSSTAACAVTIWLYMADVAEL